jgi:hypothetical protein
MKDNGINLESYFATQGLGGLNDESNCCGYLGESSFDDLDDSQDNQDNTDYENEEEEVSGVRDKCPFLEFRGYVRAKKQELKDQYGKGHISVFECGVMPFRLQTPKYNPIVRIGETGNCFGWSWSCDKKCLGLCCGDKYCSNWVTTPGNTEAYDNATTRFNADKAAWVQCRAENKGIWVPGWRREWRKFKKAGGLNQLRDQCRGVVPEAPPTPYTPTGLPCSALASTYGIIAGQDWGTAPVEIRREWQERGCKGPHEGEVPVEAKGVYAPGMSCGDMMDEFGIIPGREWGTAPIEAINAWRAKPCTGREAQSRGNRPGGEDAPTDNKKMYILIGVIVLVIIATMFIIKRQMK